MTLDPSEIDVVMAQAAEADPHECGGVVLGKGLKKRRIQPLPNVATGRKEVRHRPAHIMATEEDGWTIQAFYHTHVRQSIEPSDADLVGCSACGVPWIVVGYPNRRQTTIHPHPGLKLPLVGRPFAHGTLDCFTIIRDYYKTILDIDVPDFHRPDDWWLNGENLYMEGLDRAGFDPIPFHETRDDIRQHDVLLMKFFPSKYKGPKHPNHGAVYLGASKMIHHFLGCLSQRTFYSQYYANRTSYIARHRSMA